MIGLGIAHLQNFLGDDRTAPLLRAVDPYQSTIARPCIPAMSWPFGSWTTTTVRGGTAVRRTPVLGRKSRVRCRPPSQVAQRRLRSLKLCCTSAGAWPAELVAIAQPAMRRRLTRACRVLARRATASERAAGRSQGWLRHAGYCTALTWATMKAKGPVAAVVSYRSIESGYRTTSGKDGSPRRATPCAGGPARTYSTGIAWRDRCGAATVTVARIPCSSCCRPY